MIKDFNFQIDNTIKIHKMRKIFYLLIIGILVPLIALITLLVQIDASETSGTLSASLNRENAQLGSAITLILRYRLPRGATLPKNPEIKGIENLVPIDYQTGDEEIRINFLVDRLDSWSTGPISFAFLDKEGKTQYLSTDPVSLKVLSNLGDKPAEAKLRSIRGIIPIKPRWFKYLPWAVGLFALFLTILGLLWWYQKIQGRKSPINFQDPPHLRAKKEIEELESLGLFEKGSFKEFYFRFSEILRFYLENLRGFPAAEFTTEEIALCISKGPDRKLLPLLRGIDLVKFADTIPAPARKEEEIKTALAYIRETTPVQETASVKPTGQKKNNSPEMSP